MEALRSRFRRPLLGRSGEGNTGCVVMLLLVAIGGYVAYYFIMPYYHHNNFEQRVAEMMPYYRNQDAPYVQAAVIKVARENGLELKPEQVKVQVLKRDNRLIIDIVYTRTVELPFYTHTLTFRPHLTGTVY